MCRLHGFRSATVSRVHRSLVAAENALGKQSAFHPDGWGISYYRAGYPHLIRSVKQALSDSLFDQLSKVVMTQTLLAHVRRATVGRVSELNCHPFQHGCWSFAHNGEVSGWLEGGGVVRDAALGLVDPGFRSCIFGDTDSEVCFYVFLSHLARLTDDVFDVHISSDVVFAALKGAVIELKALADTYGTKKSELTFLLTNGSIMLGHRCGRELFFSTHESSRPDLGTGPYQARRGDQEGAVGHLIVTSEHISEGRDVWLELGENQMVIIDQAMRVQVR